MFFRNFATTIRDIAMSKTDKCGHFRTYADICGHMRTVPNFFSVTLQREKASFRKLTKTDKFGQIRTNSDNAKFAFRNFAT